MFVQTLKTLPSRISEFIKNFIGPGYSEYESKYSGTVLVRTTLGTKYILTGSTITQSGDLVTDIWRGVLKAAAQKNKTWLVLGVAGGSVISEISQKYAPKHITGIEIDPIMIEIGQKHFGLSKIPNLTVIQADAHTYMKNLDQKFDYVLVDMYVGDKLPEFVYQPAFVKLLKKAGNFVIFNHLFFGYRKASAEKFIHTLETLFFKG